MGEKKSAEFKGRRAKGAIYFNENIKKILDILRESGDNGVSGEEIAKKVGITRAAVSKNVRKLNELGYTIKVSKKYILAGSPDIPYPWELRYGKNIIFFKDVNSTQDEARELILGRKRDRRNTLLDRIPEDSKPIWIISLYQRKGRGRLGRTWISPYGNFYGSAILKSDLPMKEIVKTSLVAGLSVLKSIKKYLEQEVKEGGIEIPDVVLDRIKIKWPNDVIFEIWDENSKSHFFRKVAGVLSEAFGEPDKVEYIIVGIGVNLNVSPIPEISYSLKDFIKKDVSLKKFTDILLDEFTNTWESFRYGRWFELKTEIERNLYRGRLEIIKDKGEKKFVGFAVGINPDGSLKVEKDDASFEDVYYGDVFPPEWESKMFENQKR